jgi:hypothetical protein
LGRCLQTGHRKGRAQDSELYHFHQGEHMSATQTSVTGTKTETNEIGDLQATRKRDAAESMLKTLDKSTQKATGISLFHILTLGSIGASIALYLSGKQKAGIFIGLWPPTFQALKAVVDKGEGTA